MSFPWVFDDWQRRSGDLSPRPLLSNPQAKIHGVYEEIGDETSDLHQRIVRSANGGAHCGVQQQNWRRLMKGDVSHEPLVRTDFQCPDRADC